MPLFTCLEQAAYLYHHLQAGKVTRCAALFHEAAAKLRVRREQVQVLYGARSIAISYQHPHQRLVLPLEDRGKMPPRWQGQGNRLICWLATAPSCCRQLC